jgi:hypothetical protein
MRRQASYGWCAVAFGLAVLLGLGNPALAADVNGTWKWSVEFNGNTVETTLKLKQDGDKLTGTITGRQGSESPIDDGKVSGDKVTFSVTREFNGNKMVRSYEGTVSGDTITGQSKATRDGQEQTREWVAKRAK